MSPRKRAPVFMVGLGLILFLVAAGNAQGQQTPAGDKALCEKMMSLGKAAFDKGDFQQSKLYYRKAIQADPYSLRAWLLYDAAAKEEIQKRLPVTPPAPAAPAPGTSAGAPAATPPAASPPKEQKEEGC